MPAGLRVGNGRIRNMALSMTGFGSVSMRYRDLTFKCEVQCVNKKFLEAQVVLPRAYWSLEIPMRKEVEKTLLRGKAVAVINVSAPEAGRDVRLNHGMVAAYQAGLLELEARYGSARDVGMAAWLNLPGVWDIRENREPSTDVSPLLIELLGKALRKVQRMRRAEGKNLTAEIRELLTQLEHHLQNVETRAPDVLVQYQERLKDRVGRSPALTPQEKDLFSRFQSAFSDKCDIREEVARLKSHIKQYRTHIRKNTPVGRTLDFLLQEFFREINTIGSKANDIQVTENVVTMKSLVEKIREQTQNIL